MQREQHEQVNTEDMTHSSAVGEELSSENSLYHTEDGRNRVEVRVEYETVRLMAMER